MEHSPPMKRTWLWLLVGAALLPWSSIQPSFALAAWLAPVFLLRFARTQRMRVGLPLIALVECVALGLNWYFGTAPNAMLAVSGVGVGLLATLGYAIDRLLAPRLSDAARAMVFPLATTTIDWLGSRLAALLTPFLLPSLFAVSGAWDSPGYTQAGWLPLAQLASLTGMWGITFLVSAFASAVNAWWEGGFGAGKASRPIAAFAVALGAVTLFGAARIATAQPPAQTVRVATIASRDDLFATISDLSPGDLMPETAAQRGRARAAFAPIADDLLARTVREARAGARIIAWGEAAAPVLQEDVPTLLQRSAALAKQEGMYLQVGLIVFRNTGLYPFMENRAVLLDPSGATRWDYHKVHPTPGENAMVAPGSGSVPVIDTPYGKLATVICYDADFPELVWQAGQAGAAILLDPSKDWPSVARQHAQMATFRTVENGVWLVRPALSGESAVADPYGRTLASVDATSGEPTATALIGTSGVATFYARAGDWFAYGCAVLLLGVAGLALGRRATRLGSAAQAV